jgi:hypothetical protein
MHVCHVHTHEHIGKKVQVCVYVDTHISVCTVMCVLSCEDTCLYTWSCVSSMCTWVLMCEYAHMRVFMQVSMYASARACVCCVHICTHMVVNTHTRIYSCMCVHSHGHPCVYSYACEYALCVL